MPRITISYRRDDSGVITGRIFDRLVTRYGHESVFRDIDNIPIGVDFRHHVDRMLGASDIVLAIVGPHWIGPDRVHNRLSNEADLVRAEIEAALRKEIPLVPVLVLGAAMPGLTELPETLQDFAYRNAVQIDAGQDFDVHMARLIRAIDGILGKPAGQAAFGDDTREGLSRSQPRRRFRLPVAASVIAVLGVAGVGWYIAADRYLPPQGTGPIATNPLPTSSVLTPQTPPSLPLPPSPEKTAPAPPSADAELMFWQSISASNNAADFEEYLRQFPKGRFAGLARNRIAAFHPLPNLPPEPETPSTSQQEPQNPAQPAPSPERHQVDVGSSAYEKRDYQTAIRTLLPFAQDGDATAQYYVGLMYLKGQGVPKDDASAVEWLRKSADAGNAYARTYMGAINRRGEIVPRNYQEAMRWYLLAAKQNFKNAQYSIALMYYQGWGVNKDVKQAHVWAVIASSEGEPTFTRFRVQLERQLSDSEIAEGRKKAALWQSQNLGSDVKPAQSSQTR